VVSKQEYPVVSRWQQSEHWYGVIVTFRMFFFGSEALISVYLLTVSCVVYTIQVNVHLK